MPEIRPSRPRYARDKTSPSYPSELRPVRPIYASHPPPTRPLPDHHPTLAHQRPTLKCVNFVSNKNLSFYWLSSSCDSGYIYEWILGWVIIVHLTVNMNPDFDADFLEDILIITLCAAAFLLLEKMRRRNRPQQNPDHVIPRRPRSCWVRPWVLRRPLFGQYENLMVELCREDKKGYANFQRVPPELFNELLDRVGHRFQRRDTNYRKALEPGLRLAITLRYLASGCSYKSLEFNFRVAN